MSGIGVILSFVEIVNVEIHFFFPVVGKYEQCFQVRTVQLVSLKFHEL